MLICWSFSQLCAAGNSKANRQRKPRSKKMVAAPGAVNFDSRLYQHLKLSATRYTTSFHGIVSLMLNPCCTAFHPYGPRVEACPTLLRISKQGAHLCRNIINANSKVVLGGLEDMQCNIDLSILGYSNHPTFLCSFLNLNFAPDSYNRGELRRNHECNSGHLGQCAVSYPPCNFHRRSLARIRKCHWPLWFGGTTSQPNPKQVLKYGNN